MTDELDLLAAYVIPEGDAHPGKLLAEMIKLEQHKHFKDEEIAVEFLLRVESKIKAGRQVLGMCMLPTVQGELKSLFEQMLAHWLGRMPQFLIILDQEFWMAADDITRRALLEHEMCHVKQERDKYGDPAFDRDGKPKFGLVAHDLEEFNYIVRKYGKWKSDIAEFISAANEHNTQI